MNHKQKIWLLPYLLILFEIVVYLSNDMYLPSMPAIARDLALTQEQTQSTLTLWFLGASALQFILGPLSDRYGRRPIIVIGALSFVLSSAACAMAYTLPLLLISRFIQGSAICSILVAGYAAIHELFKTKEAIKILALMGAITILAPAFGPLVGALIVQFYSWRYIFWLLTAIGALSFISLFIYMPESNQNRHKLHIKTIARDYIKILSNKEFMLPCISYCILVGVFFLWMFEAPFLMMEIYGASTLYYGASQIFIFGCFFVGAELTNLLLNRYDLGKLVKIATATILLGTVIFAVTAKIYDSMFISIICLMLISTGSSMLFGPLNRLAIEACNQPMGRRTAVFSTMLSLFGALCGWILTLITVNTLSAISILIIVCVATATVTLLLTKVPLLDKD
jgi:DHA1 family multidrug/chloramphenicol efflux transport protein-like MFS transporter